MVQVHMKSRTAIRFHSMHYLSNSNRYHQGGWDRWRYHHPSHPHCYHLPLINSSVPASTTSFLTVWFSHRCLIIDSVLLSSCKLSKKLWCMLQTPVLAPPQYIPPQSPLRLESSVRWSSVWLLCEVWTLLQITLSFYSYIIWRVITFEILPSLSFHSL